MPRTIRDAKLETRAARDRLKPSKKPNWKTLIPRKLHLGYRKRKNGEAGTWLVRRYIGGERYRVVALGLADDYVNASPEMEVFSYDDAQRLAHEHRVEIEGRKRKGITVADAVADYISWMRVHRITGDGAGRRAELHILPTMGKFNVSDLTTAQLNHWRDALAEAPPLLRSRPGAKQNARPLPKTEAERRARRATANKVVTILKAALNHAFRNDLVSDDKSWRRLRPFAKVDAARPGSLTRDEACRLINAADAETGFRDLVHAALLTGCRYGELCELRVKDFEHGKIAVQKSKSGKPRHVRLTEEGEAFFRKLVAGRAANDFLLKNRGRLVRALERGLTDDGRWKKSEQARPMRSACVRAKIDPPLGIHQLRHTWASLSVMNGVPLVVVASNLGHADTRMVEKHYGHLTTSYLDEAIRAGAPRFGAVETSNLEPLSLLDRRRMG